MSGLDQSDPDRVHGLGRLVVLECEPGSGRRLSVLVLDHGPVIGELVVPMSDQVSGHHHGFVVPIGEKDHCHFRVRAEWLVPIPSKRYLVSALAPSSHRDFFV
jgi:hypothetical protein